MKILEFFNFIFSTVGTLTIFESNNFLARYCIRINPAGNYGHELRILLNDEEVNRIPAFADFSSEHVECYNKNDYPNEAPIYEIQPTGLDGVSITVTVDDEGSLTPLYFGENTDLDFIFMNVENPDVDIIGCPSSYGTGEATAEASSTLKIQNGVIIESECVQRLYCLEIRGEGNRGDDLLLFRNDQGQR